MAPLPALVACFPGCGWNGEVDLDDEGKWVCPGPGCGEQRTFTSHRDHLHAGSSHGGSADV